MTKIIYKKHLINEDSRPQQGRCIYFSKFFLLNQDILHMKIKHKNPILYNASNCRSTNNGGKALNRIENFSISSRMVKLFTDNHVMVIE